MCRLIGESGFRHRALRHTEAHAEIDGGKQQTEPGTTSLHDRRDMNSLSMTDIGPRSSLSSTPHKGSIKVVCAKSNNGIIRRTVHWTVRDPRKE